MLISQGSAFFQSPGLALLKWPRLPQSQPPGGQKTPATPAVAPPQDQDRPPVEMPISAGPGPLAMADDSDSGGEEAERRRQKNKAKKQRDKAKKAAARAAQQEPEPEQEESWRAALPSKEEQEKWKPMEWERFKNQRRGYYLKLKLPMLRKSCAARGLADDGEPAALRDRLLKSGALPSL